jgi:hypothetical protein
MQKFKREVETFFSAIMEAITGRYQLLAFAAMLFLASMAFVVGAILHNIEHTLMAVACTLAGIVCVVQYKIDHKEK